MSKERNTDVGAGEREKESEKSEMEEASCYRSSFATRPFREHERKEKCKDGRKAE